MQSQIVETADRIREMLQADPSVEINILIEALPDEPALVYSALGWLARGNEIMYCQVGSKTVVSSATTYHEFLW